MSDLPLLIGEAPSKSGDRYYMFPLSGAVAETLCKLAGIPPQPGGTRYGQWTWALYDHFECENLIERWPGRQGRGSAFPMDVARSKAVMMMPRMRGRVVVVLGSRLASVFTLATKGWHDKAVTYDGHGVVHQASCQITAIPHPSGLNRLLNDPAEREHAGVMLRDAMQRARAATIA